MNTVTLINEITSLPVEERALVVESVLQSLNQPECKLDTVWAEVAKSRLAQLESGNVESVDGKQVFDKIWQRFK